MRALCTWPAALREEDGSGLVEFAASAILLLTMIFGIMDCSRALYVDHFVANAAREASRYASVRGNDFAGTACASTVTFACEVTAANVTAFVKTIAPNGINTGNVTVTTTWPGTDATGATCTSSGAAADSAGCTVVVKVTYSFTFVLPLLPRTTLLIPSTSKVTIAQ